jgi:hypothetical protein
MRVKNSFKITAKFIKGANSRGGDRAFYGKVTVLCEDKVDDKEVEFLVDAESFNLDLSNLEKGKTYLLQGKFEFLDTLTSNRFTPTPIITNFKEIENG